MKWYEVALVIALTGVIGYALGYTCYTEGYEDAKKQIGNETTHDCKRG